MYSGSTLLQDRPAGTIPGCAGADGGAATVVVQAAKPATNTHEMFLFISI
jgi:hypothetical protein